jgi:hypothetical protein
MALNLCGTAGGNTGVIECDQSRGIPKKILAGSKVFAPSAYASQALFKAAFKGAVKLPEGSSSKLYPFPEIKTVTDKTEANKEGTMGLGYKETLIEGLPGYEYEVLGGQSLYRRLRKFNNVTIPVLTVDNNGNVWGTVDSDGNFSGTVAKLFVSGNSFGDGSKVVSIKISVAYQSSDDFNDGGAYFPIDFNIGEVKGLLDAELSFVSNTANAYKYTVAVATAQLGTTLSLYTDYADALAVTGLWKAYTGPGFTTPLAITTVVKDTVNGGWTVTYDSTAYAALATGAQIKQMLATPADLDAADIPNIESVAVVVTK